MKPLIVTVLLLFLHSVSAEAVPYILEKNYTNYAFGYRSNGCFIDENGFAYDYNISNGSKYSPLATRLTADEIQIVKDLLEKAAQGSFLEKRAVYDAGALEWRGTYLGKEIKLKTTGNYRGLNSAPEAEALINILDRVCSESKFPSFPD